MSLRKVAIALMVLVALSALVPLALYGQPARALSTVTVTLKVVPGIYYTYVPLASYGSTYGNASAGSLSLAGAKLLVEVEYTNGTVYSTQLVTVNGSGYISFAVPYDHL